VSATTPEHGKLENERGREENDENELRRERSREERHARRVIGLWDYSQEVGTNARTMKSTKAVVVSFGQRRLLFRIFI